MSTVPKLNASPLEIQAEALQSLLTRQTLSQPLDAAHQPLVKHLWRAFQTGKKAEVFKRMAPFYAEVLPLERLQQAYHLLHSMTVAHTPEFEIVMDSLKSQYDMTLKPVSTSEISVLEALVQVLLAVTQSDKNSISYQRLDPDTGRLRPTTFPLTPELIERFVFPFEADKTAALQRSVYFYKKTVIGNPAAELAWRYAQRKATFQQEMTRYQQLEQERQARLARELAAIPKASVEVKTKVKAASASVKQIWAEVKTPQEKQAVHYSMQPEHLYTLIAAQQQGEDTFQSRLKAMYTQKISPLQAGALSARLASKMKRVLAQMEQWDESYWSEFQGLMQQLGLWEGQAWLDKWRSHKQGKQELEPQKVEYVIETETIDPIAAMQAKEQRLADKRKGRQMLGLEEVDPTELERWLKPAEPTTSPEMQKILRALARPEHLQAFCELVLPASHLQALEGKQKRLVFRIFEQYAQTDLSSIKDQILARAAEESVPLLREILAELELKITWMERHLEKDKRQVYKDAFEALAQVQAEIQQKERLNSLEYKRSAAAQYGRYSG